MFKKKFDNCRFYRDPDPVVRASSGSATLHLSHFSAVRSRIDYKSVDATALPADKLDTTTRLLNLSN